MGTADQGGASPHWKILYHAALLETDPENSLKLITDAERAIRDRIAAIGDSVERSAIVEGAGLGRSLKVLRDLRRMAASVPNDGL